MNYSPSVNSFYYNFNTMNFLELRVAGEPGSQEWIVILFVVLLFIFLFIGMFAIKYFKEKKESEAQSIKERSNKVLERNSNETKKEVIDTILKLYNDNKDYDKSNLDVNVSKLKKEIKDKITTIKNSSEMEEYEIANGSDNLVKLLIKLEKESFTIWHNFIDEELEKVNKDD